MKRVGGLPSLWSVSRRLIYKVKKKKTLHNAQTDQGGLLQLARDTQVLPNHHLPFSAFHPLAGAFDKGSGGQRLTESRSKLLS